MEDQKIIRLLWERSERALEALSKRFGRRLMAMAKQILMIEQDAEEAVNDTYLAVWNAIPPRKPDPLSGFVYRVGRNISLDRLRYNTGAKRNTRYDVSLEELANALPAPALEEAVEARALGEAINTFLGTLSREQRVLFLRRYWFGDEIKDIAKDLNLRPNTVSVRLGRIRMQLQAYLLKEEWIHA